MLRFAKILLVLAIPACASAQGTGARPAAAHDAGHMMMHGPEHTRINVSAVGTASRPPEQAVVNLAIETAASTAQAAADENARVMDRIIDALSEMGIAEEHIRTTAYNMYPEYASDDDDRGRPEPRAPEIIGYRVMNMVSVTVDGAARAGAAIDAALAAGANRVNGLDFQLRDTEGARAEALRAAMAKARAEAELLADAAGLTLGEPIEISTSFMSPPMPRPVYMARDMAESVPTPVQPGAIEVQALVSVVYAAD